MNWSAARRVIFGTPLPTEEAAHQRLPKILALPVFASDALSSSAYATQEILLNLALAGTVALHVTLPITIAIAMLLAVVTISYIQTVHAYPSGGGAYIVASENLSRQMGLLAAAALLTDYILTVAVSVASGVQQVTSLLPELTQFTVPLCILVILFVTLANLRGVKESGVLFAFPTYFFLISVLGMIVWGVVSRHILGIPPYRLPQPPIQATTALSVALVLKAFASGCSALTGVEAISNGVQAFRPPESKNAAQTLTAMAVLLGSLVLGISYLAQANHVVYAHGYDQESAISLVARAVFHNNETLRGMVLVATALILLIAANTSFADFPRLSSILARDGFMPRQLSNLGDRLVYSNGIILLGVFSSLLIVAFHGKTDRLIPLYAVGVFLAFTLSQAGMVRHWLKLRGSGWHWKAVINGLGATATGIVLIVVLIEKTLEGAWIVVIIIPVMIWMMDKVYQHYQYMRSQLSLIGYEPEPPSPHTVLVLIHDVHRGVIPALNYAREIASDVRAVHIEVNPQHTPTLKMRWEQWGDRIPLVIIESPYRSLVGPIVEYVRQVKADHPRHIVTVVVPEFVVTRWWQRILHANSAVLIKLFVANIPGVVVTNVRYYLKPPQASAYTNGAPPR
ncbi:Putrescine importer PuuP [bacterium HR16]|nr:Putrescine importer PuuP [bacterium HR16]